MYSSSPSKLISPSGLSIGELPGLLARPVPVGSSSTAPAKPAATGKHRSTRAERACHLCHKRKIRCDVVKTAPCSNCKVDKLECTERESVRARRKTIDQKPEQKQALRSPSIISSCTTLPSPPIKDFLVSPLSSTSRAKPARKDSSSTSQHQADMHDMGEPSIELPQFFQPVPWAMSSVDAHYLDTKGAFTLPPLPLQNGLLRAYVEYVHPYMPVVYLEPFLNTIQHRDGSKGKMSLLFYHAVMLAASAFVDINLLLEAGYPSRKAARKTFFERARLLHDFDYEHDRLTLVQSVLLLTYWHDSPDGQKDLWYWMGIGISAAHSIQLHYNPDKMDLPPATQKLRKRVWWSCFIRDRLIALGARKPSRISEEESEVPMLVENDFEIGVITTETTDVARNCVFLKDADMQRELALMCIAKAQLCVHLGHALDSQYVAMNNGGGDRSLNPRGTRLLYPNQTQDNGKDIAGIDADLLDWLETLPEVCQRRPLVASDAHPGNFITTISRSVLHMLYHTTVLALYRPQSLNLSQKKSMAKKEFAPLQHDEDVSWNKVHDAAVQITDIVSDLAEFGIDKLLPTTCVILILPAMIIQVLEMKEDMAEGRDQAFRNYSKCMFVMEHLRESFYGADFAVTFLNMVMARAGIHFNAIPHPNAAGYRQDAMSTTNTLSSLVLEESSVYTPPADSNIYVQPEMGLEAMTLETSVGSNFRGYMPTDTYMDFCDFDNHDAFGWNTGAASDLDMGHVGRLLVEISPLLQRSNPMGD